MLTRWLRIGDSAAGVYGTLLTLSVLVGLSLKKSGPGVMAITIGVSAAVFWIAHVHAGLVARWVRADTRPDRHAVGEIMAREAPMIESAVPAVALMLLAWLGVLSTSAAVWTALVYGVVALAVWGALIAYRAGLGMTGMAVVSGVNLGLGLVIVVLKLLIH
ncbi:MAG: hypothetical protein JHC74_13490 [Thermoleophilia bacterium]|nr:hypothetical protein [Thermoleophilia bacterium]